VKHGSKDGTCANALDDTDHAALDEEDLRVLHDGQHQGRLGPVARWVRAEGLGFSRKRHRRCCDVVGRSASVGPTLAVGGNGEAMVGHGGVDTGGGACVGPVHVELVRWVGRCRVRRHIGASAFVLLRQRSAYEQRLCIPRTVKEAVVSLSLSERGVHPLGRGMLGDDQAGAVAGPHCGQTHGCQWFDGCMISEDRGKSTK
jgi:hypothetical protein